MMNTRSKVLHRFYEPLGLLHALGRTRGEHTTRTQPSSEQIDSFTPQELRRLFLNELAFLCDHEKGGDSVTAIGLGETPQGYVFWVAANKCPERRIVPFLTKLLSNLMDTSGHGDSELSVKIFRIGVTFAIAKLKTYAGFLLSDLARLKKFPACENPRISDSITEWTVKLQNLVEDPQSVVAFAYSNRHSDFMRQLAAFAHQRDRMASADSLQETCKKVRHNIGRLGSHARSARCLALYTPRMMKYLESHTVQAVPVPSEGHGRPATRSSTTVEAALKRMLPTAGAPEYEVYRQALARMDGLFGISRRFQDDYNSSKNKTRVHAELQVLHYFEQNNEEFAEGDKYIACSKPACFCCHLYFRHHPGGFVEPQSHLKVYLNWQPPGVLEGAKTQRGSRLEKILNFMIQDIRKDALNQIIRMAGPRTFHPDSVTGISSSVLAALEVDAVSITIDAEPALNELGGASSDYSSFDSDSLVISSPDIIRSVSDSDPDEEEGGVSILDIKWLSI